MGFVSGLQVQAQLELAEVHRTHALEQQEAFFNRFLLDSFGYIRPNARIYSDYM